MSPDSTTQEAREASSGPEQLPGPARRPQLGRKGERTRQRILEVARRRFAEVGYDSATIRDIAELAEVNKSSVIKYFGSKQDLFREVVHFDIPIDELTTPDPTRTVENYLRTMLDGWAATPDTPMSVMLRTSMTSDYAAELLRSHVTTASVDPVAAHMDRPDARVRASLFAAIMIGIASGRYLLRIPDLAEADLEDVLEIAIPVIRDLIAPAE